MKKIVLSVIVALIAITANAQVYVGGTFGVGSDKVETEGTEVRNTTFKILPEVGYELSEDWSVGTVVGYRGILVLNRVLPSNCLIIFVWLPSMVSLDIPKKRIMDMRVKMLV